MNIERKTLPEQHYLYADRQASFSGNEISDAMASGFGDVFGLVERKNLSPLSMPMALYIEMPAGDRMAFRAGVFVAASDAEQAEGDVKHGVIPAGDVFTTTHVGPYATLGQTHQAVWNYMQEQGVSKAMPVWEIYVDDPAATPEDKLRTEIYRAIES